MIVNLDMYVVQILYSWRQDWLVSVFFFLSAIGETVVMVAVTLIVAAALFFWLKERAMSVGLLATMATSTLITYALKHAVARTRPDMLYQAYAETGFSFPSGHSSAAAAFFGFFAYIAWKKMSPGPRRGAVVALATLYVLLMAFGRVYLDVHYLSDVLVGLAVGICSAFIGAIVFRWLRSHKAEPVRLNLTEET
ncbi:MAG TPA: phosphatase PAP2 family protein [Candidatus Paceibacterota bacterium]